MQPALRQGPLGHYAEYYQGLAELRLGRPADARATFQALAAKNPVGYLAEAAALREAECDEALNDQNAAHAGLRDAVEDEDDGARRSADAAWPRRKGRGASGEGRARRSRGWSTSFRSAISRRWPAASSRPCRSRRSRRARTVSSWSSGAPSGCSAPSATRRRGRCSRRCAPSARDDDRELVQLRIAECDYFLKQRAQRARRR